MQIGSTLLREKEITHYQKILLLRHLPKRSLCVATWPVSYRFCQDGQTTLLLDLLVTLTQKKSKIALSISPQTRCSIYLSYSFTSENLSCLSCECAQGKKYNASCPISHGSKLGPIWRLEGHWCKKKVNRIHKKLLKLWSTEKESYSYALKSFVVPLYYSSSTTIYYSVV